LRSARNREPAIGSVAAAPARLHLAALTGREHGSPARRHLRQVFGMNTGEPALTGSLLQAEAAVLAPTPVDEVAVPVRERRPNQAGERIDEASELVFHHEIRWPALTGRR